VNLCGAGQHTIEIEQASADPLGKAKHGSQISGV
jgi:hypothetical protein